MLLPGVVFDRLRLHPRLNPYSAVPTFTSISMSCPRPIILAHDWEFFYTAPEVVSSRADELCQVAVFVVGSRIQQTWSGFVLYYQFPMFAP
jgi:hypothetical protein